MLKLLNFFLLLTSLFFVACSDKIPFTPSKSLQDSALVYIYIPNEITSTDTPDSTIMYKLKIGNETIKGYIRDGEYMVFHIKPSNTTFYAIKNSILTHTIQINLKKNITYFLKISKLAENGGFKFYQIQNEKALKEIANTKLANSVKTDEKTINKNILKEAPKKATQTFSKTAEIQKAYKLKEQGILTQDEFTKLKQEILSK